MTQKALAMIDALQQRLSETSSDPKWLNDDVAAIREELEQAPDAVSVDPSEIRIPVRSFIDMAAAQTVSAMMATVPPIDLQVSGKDHQLRVKMRIVNMARWANFAAVQLAAVLYPDKIEQVEGYMPGNTPSKGDDLPGDA